jgi:hypothetical protein
MHSQSVARLFIINSISKLLTINSISKLLTINRKNRKNYYYAKRINHPKP